MKLILQIATGLVLGWLGIQAVTALEARAALTEIARELPPPTPPPAPPLMHFYPLTPRTTPPPTRTCEITRANGATTRCTPP
jgi:hypothetical protein